MKHRGLEIFKAHVNRRALPEDDKASDVVQALDGSFRRICLTIKNCQVTPRPPASSALEEMWVIQKQVADRAKPLFIQLENCK